MTKIFLFLLLRPAATLAGPTQAPASADSNQSEPRLQFFQIGGAREKTSTFSPFSFPSGENKRAKKVFPSVALFFLSLVRFLPLKSPRRHNSSLIPPFFTPSSFFRPQPLSLSLSLSPLSPTLAARLNPKVREDEAPFFPPFLLLPRPALGPEERPLPEEEEEKERKRRRQEKCMLL